MEILHNCRSPRYEGALVPIPISGHKTPRRFSIAEMGEHRNPLEIPPVPYYENYCCRHCGMHVMRSMPTKED